MTNKSKWKQTHSKWNWAQEGIWAMKTPVLCNEHSLNSKPRWCLFFSISSNAPYIELWVSVKGIQRVPSNLVSKNDFHYVSDNELQGLLFLSELHDITLNILMTFFASPLHYKQLLAKSSYICILDCKFDMPREHLIYNLVI